MFCFCTAPEKLKTRRQSPVISFGFVFGKTSGRKRHIIFVISSFSKTAPFSKRFPEERFPEERFPEERFPEERFRSLRLRPFFVCYIKTTCVTI